MEKWFFGQLVLANWFFCQLIYLDNWFSATHFFACLIFLTNWFFLYFFWQLIFYSLSNYLTAQLKVWSNLSWIDFVILTVRKKCIACKNAVKFIIKNLLYQSQPLIKLNKHYIWTVFHKTFVVWLLHIKCRFSLTALASCQSAVKFGFQNSLLRLQSSISSSPKFYTIQLELLDFLHQCSTLREQLIVKLGPKFSPTSTKSIGVRADTKFGFYPPHPTHHTTTENFSS